MPARYLLGAVDATGSAFSQGTLLPVTSTHCLGEQWSDEHHACPLPSPMLLGFASPSFSLSPPSLSVLLSVFPFLESYW